ncbi:MAG: hypothetical protein E7447_04095 [Ruminococcaceae bacterium]|nr:hypothetical protein [Oscillospiraceae bacterium]
MKEKLYTIPVNEGFETEDECPFCAMERTEEQRAIRYFAGPGASYMEPDVRASTDRAGFCGGHMKKLYDYGNALGCALMLQTYYAGLLEEMQAQLENYDLPPQKGVFTKKRPQSEESPYWQRLKERVNSCAICEKVDYNMARYFETFFYLLKEPEFRQKVEKSKGFCMRHFAQLLETAEDHLPNAHREWFCKTVPGLMLENMARVKEDLDWMVAKYDYRNASKPRGNSRDALQRSMQKLQGIYPADKPYKNE